MTTEIALDLKAMTPAEIRQASHGLLLRRPGERTAADIRSNIAKHWPAAVALYIDGAAVIEAPEGETEA